MDHNTIVTRLLNICGTEDERRRAKAAQAILAPQIVEKVSERAKESHGDLFGEALIDAVFEAEEATRPKQVFLTPFHVNP